MKMKKLLLSAMAFALMAPMAAHAEEPATADGKQHVVDPAKKAEWEAKKAERMARTDTDKDGLISKSEFQAEHARRGEEMFTKMDSNNDGKLAKEEMKAGREKMRDKFKKRMEHSGPMGAPAEKKQ
jgi:hypothetical protein